ncbi:hypothetical protein [Methanoculleus chikugoensis]|uniref:hypothetical protein n=1 Tax=Methanoculleus chikugoensis TaxID=118126 RepID=UPI001FB408C7|nr:hypothetical protein [Methanoculleus chikugoensis]
MVEGEAVPRQHEPGNGFFDPLRQGGNRVEGRGEVVGEVTGKPPPEKRGSGAEATRNPSMNDRRASRGSAASMPAATSRIRGSPETVSVPSEATATVADGGGADERVTGGLRAPPLKRLEQEPGPFAEGGIEVGRRSRGERDLSIYRDDERPAARVRRGNGLLVSRSRVQLSWSAVQSTGITPPSPVAGRATL